jgi:hypothetical protein
LGWRRVQRAHDSRWGRASVRGGRGEKLGSVLQASEVQDRHRSFPNSPAAINPESGGVERGRVWGAHNTVSWR